MCICIFFIYFLFTYLFYVFSFFSWMSKEQKNASFEFCQFWLYYFIYVRTYICIHKTQPNHWTKWIISLPEFFLFRPGIFFPPFSSSWRSKDVTWRPTVFAGWCSQSKLLHRSTQLLRSRETTIPRSWEIQWCRRRACTPVLHTELQ